MQNGLPIECDDREDTFDQGEGDIIFTDVVFTENLGPFKKGEHAEKCVLNVFGTHFYSIKDGRITKEVYLKFVPKSS